jgi:hypothetical protein
VSPRVRGRKGRKRCFRVERIETQSTAPQVKSYIPFYFDLRTSKVQMAETPDLPIHNKAVENKPIAFNFDGLFGLDEQLEQLLEHITRINEVIDPRSEHYLLARPSPVLLHGPSGTNN